MPAPARGAPRCRAADRLKGWSATSLPSGEEPCGPGGLTCSIATRCEARAACTAFGLWAAWQGGRRRAYCIGCRSPGPCQAPREAAIAHRAPAIGPRRAARSHWRASSALRRSHWFHWAGTAVNGLPLLGPAKPDMCHAHGRHRAAGVTLPGAQTLGDGHAHDVPEPL